MISQEKLQTIQEVMMERDDDYDDYDVCKGDKKKGSVRRILSVKCADVILDWIIFPLLLFVQFGSTMYYQQSMGMRKLPWAPTMGVISVFCIASVKFRNLFRTHPVQSIALLLLPEVFTNVVLAIVMVSNDLSIAFHTLIALTVVIVVTTLVGHCQMKKYKRAVVVPMESEYKLLPEEEDEGSDDEWVC